VNDEDQCLYAGTPWEAEVVTDRRGLETFREVACTIGTVLLVRTFVDLQRFLLRVFECREVQLCALLCSLLLSGRKLGRVFCGRR
jgi:hypothetical protein